ncbi:MAG: hypothetical protein OEO23_02600 [Gemmatimonadota bacterium]|nr:hypothetical protein [Gemmatimonadota bacterium]
MATRCGIWVDQREAILIFVDGDDIRVRRVESDAESERQSAGGSPGITAKGGKRHGGRGGGLDDALPERKIGRRRQQSLKRYYENVAAAAQSATALLLFGPGQARDELAKVIEASAPGRATIWSEASDKLTEPQMVAHVRAFFDVSAE